MEGLSSLETVRSELLRRRLPRGYVRRIMAELADHQQDIADSSGVDKRTASCAMAAAAERLGDPVVLADFVASQYRRRTFAGRHPVWAFVVAPIPLAIGVWIAYAALALGTMWAVSTVVGYHEGQPAETISPLFIASAWTLHYASMIVPWAAAAGILAWLARRGGLGAGWSIAGAAMVGLLAICFRTALVMPTGLDHGQYRVGLGFGWSMLWSWHSLQALVPLAVAGALLVRALKVKQSAEIC